MLRHSPLVEPAALASCFARLLIQLRRTHLALDRSDLDEVMLRVEAGYSMPVDQEMQDVRAEWKHAFGADLDADCMQLADTNAADERS